MEQQRELKRETKERDFDDGNIYTILFTAGTALVTAGLKRAVMHFFIEQWRLWVFLVLNLVLLAIFFTSMRSTKREAHQESENRVNIMEERIRRPNKQSEPSQEDKEKDETVYKHNVESAEAESEYKSCNLHFESDNENVVDEEENEDEMEPPRLSKEELNERVEAFIATFRQHLVSDARKCREHSFYKKKESEKFTNLQKRSNINISSHGAKYLVMQA